MLIAGVWSTSLAPTPAQFASYRRLTADIQAGRHLRDSQASEADWWEGQDFNLVELDEEGLIIQPAEISEAFVDGDGE